MSNENEEMEMWTFFGRGFLFWSILVGLVCVAGTTVNYVMLPMWLGMERKANVESHQYVESRKTEIATNIQAFNELSVRIAQNEGNAKVVKALKMQQNSLKRRIQLAMSKIHAEDWPPGAASFN